VRAYYQQFEEQQTQSLIDQKVKEHFGQTAAGVGTAFQQHLAALQSGQYKPPILGSAPGVLPSSQPPLLSSIRLPVLPVPTAPTSGTVDANFEPR
jgi:U1 small nuclear ribonucleoprotein C